MSTLALQIEPLSRKDFVTDLEPRWCPGCGDYAVLSQMQKLLPELGIPREDIVFVSGIGCSSRFPYYMNTYGIHSIHGRAPTLATGIKVANPSLSVWVITGDGDGLTKGQYSPTSRPGHRTKTSPFGTVEQAFNPISVGLGAEATFVALTVDRNTRHMGEMLRRAAQHHGTSFVEVLQNCALFNDGEWNFATDPEERDDHVLYLEHGKPMVFGRNRDRGIRLRGLRPEVVELGNGVTEAELLVHDEQAEPPALPHLLSRMDHPHFPLPLGVLRCVKRPVFEEQVREQEERVVEERGEGELSGLFRSDETWDVLAEE
ncbi:MAG: thiamine pyrophosphate-dependent enzyme [Candidatus Latescibacterota bacterium]